MEVNSDPCHGRPKRSSRKIPIVYDEEADEFVEHDRKKRATPNRSTRKNRAAPKRTARRDASKSARSNQSDDSNAFCKAAESQAWPDKYRPSKSCRFVGNNAAIAELRSWLATWKERHAQWTLSKKPRQSQSDSEDSTEAPSNCLLLTGPPGVGKTSAVYYLAEELGYKVLEVHASSERTGRKILSQLQEATQSHHVEGTKLSLGSLQACFAAAPAGAPQVCVSTAPSRSQPEAPARKRGRPPKNPKAGPLQKLFRQASLQAVPQQVLVEQQTKWKSSPKETPKATITGYFAVKTEEKSVPQISVVPKESVGPKESLKGTLLDYFGGSTRKNKSFQATSATKPVQNLCGSVSSGEIRKHVPPSSPQDEDCDVVVVGVSTQACKPLADNKQVPKSVMRLSSKLRDDDKDNDVCLVSCAGQAASTELKGVCEKPIRSARKERKTKPPSPTKVQEPLNQSHECSKSNLSYSSSSIILFDDVDSVFAQDDGFWSAVESVLSSTKKPVVFTATRDIWQVRSKLPSHCPVVEFATPTCGEVVELLEEICSLEGIGQPSAVELDFLVQYHHCDVRRCLSELQLRSALRPETPSVPKPSMLSLGDLPLGDKLQNILHLDSCAEFVEAQLMFEELGLDLAYLSLPGLLPFPVIEARQKQSVAEISDESERRVSALDVSWLSDRESGEETDVVETCKVETEAKLAAENSGPRAELSKHCLGLLAEMFDSFSVVDCLAGRLGLGAANTQPPDRIHGWQDGAVSPVDERTYSSAASECLAYIEACSAKLRACQLRRLVGEAAPETSELGFVVTDIAPSLSNLYNLAESGRVLESKRRQIIECAVPASVAINSSAVLDFISALRSICALERKRMGSNNKRSRRFFHYLDSCSLFLADNVVDLLCAGLG
ncbi:ATPase family AAA domain-containing protein 5 [Ixodes scapularis]|uniref:ATPase family AAA domain-containing protein 5 n=1 Tax=Ixodes scapularis TaxID=6945 RepID=UPI001A9FF19D|nr:ATPase family AAA domain-containing protein 5 [Ixodes scapularis]